MRQVFLISDLHLGGPPDVWNADDTIKQTGFQICNAYADLHDFVHWVMDLGEMATPEQVELVVNGDIVDFLAENEPPEDRARTFLSDQDRVITKLDKIVERTRVVAGEGFFDALRLFLAKGHRLTFVLGNHDVELSLPRVRRHLEQEILESEGKLFRFVYDGEAYSIGKLVIEHGNRYDCWNQIDYSGLRQERSALSRGILVPEEMRTKFLFVAPPGTFLVIQFMNTIKSRYRFVDLLKPETSAVIPLLLALEPSLLKNLIRIMEIGQIGGALLQRGVDEDGVTKRSGDLKAQGCTPASTLEAVLTYELGGDDAALFLNGDQTTSGDLAAVEGHPVRAWLEAAYSSLSEKASSLSKLIRSEVTDQVTKKLRIALQRLNAKSLDFEVNTEGGETYLDAARRLTRDGRAEVVVFGHTHLPKDVRLGDGDFPRYLNTGTWADVMKLPDAVLAEGLAGDAALEEFLDAIRANNFGKYVKRFLSYVEVCVKDNGDGNVESARLYSFCGKGSAREKPLTNRLG